jgi:multidrug efflux pump subunit AcrA (membrane-fusion protein)
MIAYRSPRVQRVLVQAMPALQLAKTPRMATRLSFMLIMVILVLPFVLLLAPWTQYVLGVGRAIAFNPIQRPQFIVSPIEGRVRKWYVVEGQRVTLGQRIVELVDNDPNLERRLLDEERAILDNITFANARIRDIESRIAFLEGSRRLALDVERLRIDQAVAALQGFEQKLIGDQAVLRAAELNHKRQTELFRSRAGTLVSERDVEVAEQQLDTARATVKQSEQMVTFGKKALEAAHAQLERTDNDTNAMLKTEQVNLASAQIELARVRQQEAQIKVRIARQRAQYIDAPCTGTIFRLLANAEQGGILVRPGERLAVLVPDIKKGERVLSEIDWAGAVMGGGAVFSDPSYLTANDHPGIVAELLVDGNDLPLIRRGDRVRLQFEGWPAVQFVGWPSVAVGTFGGRVYLVDPTANEKGQFRILVEPDKDDQPWPNEDYLRQGVRAQGWVLLNEVTLGWELWRQLNGFPPSREIQKLDKGAVLGPVQKVGKK